MEAIIEDIEKAVELYELENYNAIKAFHEKAILVYNFAAHPQLLETIEHTYIVGVFYSYIEGALRDTDLSTIPVENAFYCFAKTMKTICRIGRKNSVQLYVYLFLCIIMAAILKEL